MRVLTLVALVVFLDPTASLIGQATNGPEIRPAIEHLLQEQSAAWNRGDGPAWASAFTDDADFINIRGDVFEGRLAIGQRHALIFNGPFKGSHVTVTVRRLTSPAPGVAIVETDQEVTGFAAMPPGVLPTAPGVDRTHMKYVVVEHDGKWQITAAQNTAVVPPTPTAK